ncbi:MAG: TolB-like translocation protein [Chitinophagaceae bacterium]
MKMKFYFGFLLAALFLCLGNQRLFGQEFGGNPPSLKWEQINTDTARIIFPRGLELEGERVANMIHYENAHDRKSIGPMERKIDIVLQNQSLQSNGYVALGPFRSEFLLTPSPSSFDLGSNPWLDQLCLHEYRHALQNMNFRKGISNTMSYLFGQQGQDLATNAAIPDWFWEGDAVFMETALSEQGRGRLPSFFNGFRGLMEAHKNYPYLKIRNGSYQDLIPDHYPLGYLLCAYGREKFGNDFWKKVTGDAVRYKGLFYSLPRSIQHWSGENFQSFYHDALRFYDQGWEQQKDVLRSSGLALAQDVFFGTGREVVNDNYPSFLNADTLVMLKSSFKMLPAFYLTDLQGHLKRIRTQSIVNNHYFSYAAGKIVWVESRFDPRWAYQDFGVLRELDIKTGKLKTLSHRTKYFSPGISSDGKQIVLVEVPPSLHYSLKILDAKNGRLMRQLPNPDHFLYTYPKFSQDGNWIISSVRNDQGEMALIRQEVVSGVFDTLVPFTHQVIGIPAVGRSFLFFAASFQPIDQIYAFSLKTHHIYQVTAEANGAYQPAVNPQETELVFTEYSIVGDQLKKISLKSEEFKRIHRRDLAVIHNFFVKKALDAEGGNILDKVPHRVFTIEPYHQASKLIRIHSWEPDLNAPDYGVKFLSNNILNTMEGSADYTFNTNEHSHSFNLQGVYGGFYPYIQGGGSYTLNRNFVNGIGKRIYWNETNWNLGLTVPLNFSQGVFYRSFVLGTSYQNTSVYFQPGSKSQLKDFSIPSWEANVSLDNQRIKAYQNIFSHFAQGIYLQYQKSLNQFYAEQFFASGNFYFPGFWANQNIIIQGAFQQRDQQHNYSFTDHFPYSRGYTPPTYSRIFKIATNYQLPILYPDWGFGGITYFLRVRGDLFYDFSQATSANVSGPLKQDYNSLGVEIYFDNNWWNEFPFTVGFRISHLLNTDPQVPGRKNFFELVLPVQLF